MAAPLDGVLPPDRATTASLPVEAPLLDGDGVTSAGLNGAADRTPWTPARGQVTYDGVAHHPRAEKKPASSASKAGITTGSPPRRSDSVAAEAAATAWRAPTGDVVGRSLLRT
jgi:hypothetical protein